MTQLWSVVVGIFFHVHWTIRALFLYPVDKKRLVAERHSYRTTEVVNGDIQLQTYLMICFY